MRESLKNIRLVVFIAFSVVIGSLGQGLWANTVFCIGEEGHAVFERVHNGTHANAPPRSDDDPSTYILSSDFSDNPCSDIPVFSCGSYQHHSFEGNLMQGNRPLSSGARGKTLEAGIHSAHCANQSTEHPTSTHLSLLTTILLI